MLCIPSEVSAHTASNLDSQQKPAISGTEAMKQTVTTVPKKTYYRTITLTNDACDSKMVVKSLFPSAVLKPDQPASSFITLSKFGDGKTSLRREYFKLLLPADYFKLLILNQDA